MRKETTSAANVLYCKLIFLIYLLEKLGCLKLGLEVNC